MVTEDKRDQARSTEQDEAAKNHDTNADELSADLAQDQVDAGDIERADDESVKTGARYGGHDSGLGIKGTNKPPKD